MSNFSKGGGLREFRVRLDTTPNVRIGRLWRRGTMGHIACLYPGCTTGSTLKGSFRLYAFPAHKDKMLKIVAKLMEVKSLNGIHAAIEFKEAFLAKLRERLTAHGDVG